MATAGSSPASKQNEMQPSIEELLATRLSVTSLKIQGASRTSADLLNRLLNPVLSTGGTFEGVIEDVSEAVDRLRATNCFKGVDAYLDTTESGDASVNFTLSEKGWYQIHTGTSMETTSERGAIVEGSLLFRNLRGSADTLKAAIEWGGSGASLSPDPSTAYDIQYLRPFVGGLNNMAFASLRNEQRNHVESSSYGLHTRRGEIGLDAPLGTFAVSAAWREVGKLDKDASPLIREDAKHTWITALKHMMATDTRDNPLMPTTGTAAELTSVMALPMGDVTFTKLEGALQKHISLAGGALSLSARGGIVLGKHRTPLPDRFFLGGANSFRGFVPRGVGPRDRDDAIGGDLFYTLTGLLSLPFPTGSLLSQLFNARMHIFGSAGDLTEVGVAKEGMKRLQGRPLEKVKSAWEGLSKSARVSVGLGVALETGIGRVEINFCQALRKGDGDRIKSGVQFGISESFS